MAWGASYGSTGLHSDARALPRWDGSCGDVRRCRCLCCNLLTCLGVPSVSYSIYLFSPQGLSIPCGKYSKYSCSSVQDWTQLPNFTGQNKRYSLLQSIRTRGISGALPRSMPQTRKQPSERLRRLVHFLLKDADYLALVEAAPPGKVSEWCRDAILEKLTSIRKRLHSVKEQTRP